MIANIPNSGGSPQAKPIVFYHEGKVNRGDAKVLDGNTMSASAMGFIHNLESTARLRPSVYKNKFYNIDLDFAPQDGKLSDEKMLKIAHDYMKELNLENNPYRIYRHFDSKHEHIHIVCSSVNFDGEQTLKEKLHLRHRSFELCRELEIKHNLFQVQTNSRQRARYSVSELNMDRYSFQNALKKGFKRQSFSLQLGKHYNASNIFALTKKPLTNHEIKSKLGEETYSHIYQMLDKQKLFNRHYKISLMQRLDTILENAKSPQDFTDLARDNNIYVRRMTDNKGQSYFKYILRDYNFEISDKSLSARFRYNNIVNRNFTKNHQQNKSQKQTEFNSKNYSPKRAYFARSIDKTLRKSNTWKEFTDNLKADYNIDVTFNKNSKNTIYGLTFSQENIKFKGSEINRKFSYSNIDKQLNENLQNTLEQQHKQILKQPSFSKQPQKNISNAIGNEPISKGSAPDGEEEERFKRKKNAKNISNY